MPATGDLEAIVDVYNNKCALRGFNKMCHVTVEMSPEGPMFTCDCSQWIGATGVTNVPPPKMYGRFDVEMQIAKLIGKRGGDRRNDDMCMEVVLQIDLKANVCYIAGG